MYDDEGYDFGNRSWKKFSIFLILLLIALFVVFIYLEINKKNNNDFVDKEAIIFVSMLTELANCQERLNKLTIGKYELIINYLSGETTAESFNSELSVYKAKIHTADENFRKSLNELNDYLRSSDLVLGQATRRILFLEYLSPPFSNSTDLIDNDEVRNGFFISVMYAYYIEKKNAIYNMEGMIDSYNLTFAYLQGKKSFEKLEAAIKLYRDKLDLPALYLFIEKIRSEENQKKYGELLKDINI